MILEINGACSEPTHIYDPYGHLLECTASTLPATGGSFTALPAPTTGGRTYPPHKTTTREFLNFAYQRKIRAQEVGRLGCRQGLKGGNRHERSD